MFRYAMVLFQRPAESQTIDDKEETACKDTKSVFKFRAATLQSGSADSKYSNNGKLSTYYNTKPG